MWAAIAIALATSAVACGSGGTSGAVTVDAVAPDGVADDATGLDAGVDIEAPGDVQPEAPPPPLPYPRPSYTQLSETGLFADISTREISGQALPFEPTYKLWSDGADKRRWVEVPPGTRIDTSDMDHWIFPVGTRFWKEFSREGLLLETRLIERYGEGPDDYWMGAFVWNAEQTDATFAIEGQPDINGTTHDAPSQKLCGSCHRGDPGRVLGLSAIQMSRGGDGLTLAALSGRGLLSQPPPGTVDFPVPGDPPTAAAVGYLHANCGHCHNKNGTSWPDTQMVLRLRVAERELASSELYTSNLGKKLQYWRGGPITLRLVPGAPDASAITARMHVRGSMDQMPPLATEVVDAEGFSLVRDWIAGLAP